MSRSNLLTLSLRFLANRWINWRRPEIADIDENQSYIARIVGEKFFFSLIFISIRIIKKSFECLNYELHFGKLDIFYDVILIFIVGLELKSVDKIV